MRRASPWPFLLPALLLLAGFLAYPIARSLWLSAHKAAGPAHTDWIGLANYAYLLHDALFWRALGNTVLYAVAFVVLQLSLALILALALDLPRLRGAPLIRMALFCPHLIGAAFAAILAAKLLHLQGPLNRLLGLNVNWLGDPATALWAVMAVGLWLSVGYAVVYLQAALRGVDRGLHEAASIDGAGPARRFLDITLPGIRPTLALLALVSTIGALQLFELPFVMTGGAGPDNATLTVAVYLYQQGFDAGNLGYAAAVGWALTLLIALLSLVHLRRGGALGSTP
jgi:lactose/L-arabinose transport system permease protein